MFLAGELVPAWLIFTSSLVMLAACGLCAWYAPWTSVRLVPTRQHLLLGGICGCVVIWLMSVHIIDNLWLHFLGITALVTLVGLRFALLVGAVATLLFALLIKQSVAGVPTGWLATVAAPAIVSRLVVYKVRALRSNNLFLYLLGVGFAGGMLAMLATVVTALALLLLCGQQAWVSEAMQNWPLLLLILFPEGFINGMTVTTLTVFFPHLVKTFDEDYYLGE